MNFIEKIKWIKLQKEIAEWNEKTFPDNTEFAQYTKLASEALELNQAVTRGDLENTKEEICDVVISSIGLLRFSSKLCRLKVDKSVKEAYVLSKKIGFDLYQSVVDKMEINKKRIFKKKQDGTHQHCDSVVRVGGYIYEKTKH